MQKPAGEPAARLKRLGIFFFYDAAGVVDRYVDYFLSDLRENLAELLVVVNGRLNDDGRRRFERLGGTVLIRENRGFDVWAYREALHVYGWDDLSKFDEIVLCNFTMFGPLYPFSEMFDAMARRSELDFWGITKSPKIPYDPLGTIPYHYLPEHLQSNFLVIRKRLFSTPEYRKFWEQMPLTDSYEKSVGCYEATFTKKFSDLGFRYDSYIAMDDLAEVTSQALLYVPQIMIGERRCPIVKRRIFFHNYYDTIISSDGSEARKLLEFLAEHFSYDIGMIWENLIRTCDMGVLKRNLQLDYVLPKFLSAGKSASRVALIFHLHFRDQIDECFRYLANLPDGTDFYIGATDADAVSEIERRALDLHKGSVTVRPVPNRGRDLGTLLIEFRDVVDRYDYICFAHDKKAGQIHPRSIGLVFRDRCFENMLGSKKYVENVIRLFDENPYLGMLMPPYPMHGVFLMVIRFAWLMNFENTLKLAKKMKLRVLPQMDNEPVAPLGSFFWFRAKAWRTMLAQNWKYTDFPEEPIAEDGTILHALERVRPFAVQHDGFYSAWVHTDEYARTELTNLHFMLREALNAVDIGAATFLDFIQGVRYLRSRYPFLSKEWCKVFTKKYLPYSIQPFLKRLYWRIRRK